MTPALTADQWISGIDKNPNLISFKDGQHTGGGGTSTGGTLSSAEKYDKYDLGHHLHTFTEIIEF